MSYSPHPVAGAQPHHRGQSRGTPFGHAAAGAGIWYVALIVGVGVWTFRTGSGHDRVIGALITGFVLWGLTTVIMWALARKVRIKPWVLIFVSLAIYYVLAQVLVLMGVAVGVTMVVLTQ
ncbi:hypothetical protein JNUCC0626_46035 [Lentzea sp. JNUCC 0626]|uniref:hypothetical protein n=1 Tax=Lentzea sp. JNUCC 0626 TaxID=3367513 RepID=UPI003747AADA